MLLDDVTRRLETPIVRIWRTFKKLVLSAADDIGLLRGDFTMRLVLVLGVQRLHLTYLAARS